MIDALVQKLSNGIHEISIGLDGMDYAEIEACLKSGYIHIQFIETQGETEIAINIDSNSMNLSEINFINAQGTLHLEGTTNLNSYYVRLISDIDIESKGGKRFLKIEAKV